MEAMRQSWSDDRLDDLNNRVEGLRREMHDGFAQLRAEMQAGDTQLREEMQAGFTQLRSEMKAGFDALNRTIIQVGGGFIGTLIAAFAGLVATQL
jgi:hypothetical protein